MGLFGKKRQTTQVGTNLIAPPYEVGMTPRIALWAPMGNVAASEQVGRLGGHIPTMMGANIPGIQLKGGVEGLDPHWQVLTASDFPYFLQTQYAASPGGTLRVAGRPGESMGPAGVSELFGPARLQRAQEVQTMAAGLLGW